MEALIALWLPILLSSVLVFVASFIMQMVLPHHKSDFAGIADEDGFSSAIRDLGIGRGQYSFPHAASPEEMKQAAWQEKANAGPVGILIIGPNGCSMTRPLIQWFFFVLVISLIAGYLGSATLDAGAAYLEVFQVVGCAAFLGYVGAMIPYSIWFNVSWGLTIKNGVDGLVYGLLTAGIFGWLWP